MMSTQVSGKYHREDDSVFALKRVLTGLGVTVLYPLADAIMASNDNHAFAFDPTTHSFGDIERHYYESIRACTFHSVCNRFKAHLGYLGGSASLEMAYAMCYERPIVALHAVDITATVDNQVRSFLLPRLHHLTIHDFLQEPSGQSEYVLSYLREQRIDYGVTDDEKHFIERHVHALLDELTTEKTDATA